MTTDFDLAARRGEFRRMASLLTALAAFAGLTLFAEGVYRPLKHMATGLAASDGTAFQVFRDSVLPLAPAALLVLALWLGRGLFAHLATGPLLGAETSRGVRRIGEAVLAAAVTALAIGGFGGAVGTSWALLAGLAAFGLALRGLGAVLDHAAAVQADNDAIV